MRRKRNKQNVNVYEAFVELLQRNVRNLKEGHSLWEQFHTENTIQESDGSNKITFLYKDKNNNDAKRCTCNAVVFDYLKYIFLLQNDNNVSCKDKKELTANQKKIFKGCCLPEQSGKFKTAVHGRIKNVDKLSNAKEPNGQSKHFDPKSSSDNSQEYLKDYSEIVKGLEKYKLTQKYLANQNRHLKDVFFGAGKAIVIYYKNDDAAIERKSRRRCVLEAVESTLEHVCHEDNQEEKRGLSKAAFKKLQTNGNEMENNAFSFLGLDDFNNFISQISCLTPFSDPCDERTAKETLWKIHKQRKEIKFNKNTETGGKEYGRDIEDLHAEIAKNVGQEISNYKGVFYPAEFKWSCIRDLIYLCQSLTTVKTTKERYQNVVELKVKAEMQKIIKTAEDTMKELKEQPDGVLDTFSVAGVGFYVNKAKKYYIVFEKDNDHKPTALLALGELSNVLGEPNNSHVLATYTQLTITRIVELYKVLRTQAPKYAWNNDLNREFTIKQPSESSNVSINNFLEDFFEKYVRKYHFLQMTNVDSVVYHVIKHSPLYKIAVPIDDKTGSKILHKFFAGVTKRILEEKPTWNIMPYGGLNVVYGDEQTFFILVTEKQTTDENDITRKTNRIVLTSLKGAIFY